MLPEPIRHLIRNFLAGNPYRGQPDDAVWAAVRSGDRADPAFGQALCVLLERAGGPVFAVCRKHLGLGADAEDVFQDAVIALIRRPPRRVATFAQARAWLCAVARNKAVDRLKQRNAAGPLADETVVSSADPAPDDRLDAVLAAVAALKEKYRVPFQLAAIDGLTSEAIAGRLGITAEAAQKRVERARGMVLRALAGRGVAPAAAGAVLQSTLTEVGRAAMPPERAASLTAAVLARLAALPAASTGMLKAAAVLVAGLTVGGAGLAGWAMQPTPEPESAQVPPPKTGPAPVVERETLQAKNLRILHAEVLPKLVAGLGQLLGHEPVVTHTWAEGSEVYVHGEGRRPFLPIYSNPPRVKMRFCVLTRLLVTRLDAGGTGEWAPADVNRLRFHLDGSGRRFIDIPIGHLGLREAFDALPPDDRAAAEFARFHLEGNQYGGSELVVPGWDAVPAANARYLYLAGDGHLLARDARGGFAGWRWVGAAAGPGHRPLAATDRHLFATTGREVLVRPADPAAHPWRSLGTLPPAIPGGGFVRLAVAGGRLFGQGPEQNLWSRLADDGPAEWRPAGRLPDEPDVFFGGPDRLFCRVGWETVLARPAAGDGPWEPFDRVPAADRHGLVAWGDRLVRWSVDDRGGAGVEARPLTPGPAAWTRIGRVDPTFRNW
jgi:RNA polymerase sigma-70 factor (ECF subfamily)